MIRTTPTRTTTLTTTLSLAAHDLGEAFRMGRVASRGKSRAARLSAHNDESAKDRGDSDQAARARVLGARRWPRAAVVLARGSDRARRTHRYGAPQAGVGRFARAPALRLLAPRPASPRRFQLR